MLTTTRAIVLNKTKYGDKRLLVSMFTRDYGMMSFSSPLSRRKGLKTNYFQPLSVLEISFDLRATVRIHALRNVRLAEPQKSIPFDGRKLAITLLLADCLRFALREEQRNIPLFDFICRSLRRLDDARTNYANFHIVFLTMLTAHLGFSPNISEAKKHAWFSLNEGCFTSTQPAPDAAIPPEKAAIIPLLARLNFRTMRLLRLNRDQRNECTAAILEYFRRHVPDFPELRSFAIVKELFE